MKIFEIVEPKNVEKLRNIPFDVDLARRHADLHHDIYMQDDPKFSGGPIPGRGLYSKGRTSIQDPFMFSKISVSLKTEEELESDSYYNYVNAIKPYIASNPYFPRVYVVKIEKDRTGLIKIKYQIEKLLDLKELGNTPEERGELLRSINRRILNQPPLLPLNLVHIISNATEDGNFTRIKDPLLLQAIELIRDLHDKLPGSYIDLHSGNILFRRTAQGLWPVLADPLGGS